jgi:heavy metal sensor kinase
VVLLLVLVVAGLAVVTVHRRLGQARVDEELASAFETVRGVIHNEIDERLTLPQAAEDMLEELNLPGVGVAVISTSGEILASTASRPPRLSDAAIKAARQAPDFAGDGAERMRRQALPDHHRDYSYTLAVWTSMQGLARESATLQQAIWIGVPIALILAGLGGSAIARHSLRPLADMATQADSIDCGLNDAQLVVRNPDDELGSLARAFNRLLRRVAESLHSQRAFMADASHQLRTPVSVVRTAAQVTLSQPDRSAEEYRESLEIVSRQSLRLTKMVDDMFMLAMVDAEGRPLQRSALYLNEIVDSVARDASPLAVEKGVSIDSSTGDDVSFNGDEDLLRHMLWNLVENAVRYSPAGSAIALSIAQGASQIEIVVADNGVGIPIGDRARVFDRFVRLESAGGAAGAGLGLPIARWIAEAHGGLLTLDDTARGCRFRITLPRPA